MTDPTSPISTQIFNRMADLYYTYTTNIDIKSNIEDDGDGKCDGDKCGSGNSDGKCDTNYCYVSGFNGNEVIEDSVRLNSPSPPLLLTSYCVVKCIDAALQHDITTFDKKILINTPISSVSSTEWLVQVRYKIDILKFNKTKLRPVKKLNTDKLNTDKLNTGKLNTSKQGGVNVTGGVDVTGVLKKLKMDFAYILVHKLISIFITTNVISMFEIDSNTLNDLSEIVETHNKPKKNIVVLVIRKQLFYVIVGYNIGLAVGLIANFWL